jgi:hypothetical protein
MPGQESLLDAPIANPLAMMPDTVDVAFLVALFELPHL